MLVGHKIDGGSVSFTVASKQQPLVPATLDATHETVVVPTLKKCGEVMTLVPIRNVTVGSGTPLVVTVNATSCPHCPGALFVVMLLGHVIVGVIAPVIQTLVAVHVDEIPITVAMERI